MMAGGGKEVWAEAEAEAAMRRGVKAKTMLKRRGRLCRTWCAASASIAGALYTECQEHVS
jgi:hypothetical protein